MQIKIKSKIYTPKVGDVVRYGWMGKAGFTDRQYLALVVDTTCVQARVRWLNHPTYPNLCTWVNIRSLEIIA